MRRAYRQFRRAAAVEVPPLLRRANQMMDSGNYAEAASAFEQMARAAEARGGPRAPLFYIQAGRARILAGQTEGGIQYLERGLGLFAARGRPQKLFGATNRIVKELNGRGLNKEAQQITDYVKGLMPGFTFNPNEEASAKHPPLPTHCPGCGAPVHPDQVDWLDDITAECEFCGSPVRGE